MAGFFYKLGKMAGPKVRKAQWMWAAATAPEAEAIAAEHRVGAEMAHSIKGMSPPCTDRALTDLLATIGERLKSVNPNTLRDFTFACVDSETPQAFCLPGGFIFISSAMMDLCERDPDIIAFIGAHEMVHVMEGHVMNRMLVNAVISTVGGKNPVRQVAGRVLQKLGIDFLQSAYSQENEFEADARALRLTAAAGFDPAAALTLFDKLARFEAKPLLGRYFSTHPAGAERIGQLQKHLNNTAKRP